MSLLLREVLTLPLLPPLKIPSAVKSINEYLEVQDEEQASSTVIKFKALTGYIQKYWFKNWSDKDISCHRQIRRTNNNLETYHMALNRMTKTNPTPSLFIRNFHS